MVTSLLLLMCASARDTNAAGCLEHGRQELRMALGNRAADVSLAIKPGPKESFTITPHGGRVDIVGGDATGAMYGAFEFAERVKNDPAHAWKQPVKQSPYLPQRGLNLFLTLPWDYKKNDTDYSPAALTDPNRWWFKNENYWATLLDLMTHSRLNWLDIHGMWDISVTDAPNLYAYFIQSAKFPQVGLDAETKKENLRQLNHVIELAHQRGIQVSLMAYQADIRIPQNRTPPYKNDESTIYDYTKDVVEGMIRQAPGLDAIGFRIGESGKSESFFKCYGEAVKNSGRDIPLITRSWITRRQNVLPLARASKDFSVEIKYNGEQWGAPYMVEGGRVPNWYSYAFEDYLSDAGKPGANTKTWPGWPATGGGKWPSEPYKVVWQVRANGTHRIFPFYNPEWVRRSIKEMKIGTASGYTVEGLDAYYPKSPDYYQADPKDKYCDWIHQRDEMYWTTWGRLGYDPSVSESTFDKQAIRSLTADGIENTANAKQLLDSWKRASILVSQAFMAFSLGPDHRNHAPELEWGGDTASFIQGQGLDSFSFLPINEEFANRATNGLDGRYSLWDIAVGMNGVSRYVDSAEPFKKSASGRIREIAHAVTNEATLGYYYAQRFKAAHQTAHIEAASGKEFGDDNVEYMQAADSALDALAKDAYYKPFTERLRMRTNTFSWRTEHEKAVAETTRMAALPKRKNPEDFWAANMSGPTKGQLTWEAKHGRIVVHLKSPKAERAFLLVKPLPSSTYFHRLPMRREADGFVGEFARQRCGSAIAAEAFRGRDGARFPDWQEATPYEIVPPLPGPTPQIFSASEAMAHLQPSVLDPAKYGGMLIGTRAGAFWGFDRTTKRKLLEPVERGMRLIILQQDFLGRYKLDWLPKPLKVEAAASNIFDPGQALGLEKARADGIMWQRFASSEGWKVFGNGGIARLKWGKGEIWVTTARLMQTMQYPAPARAFVKLLSLGGKTKPTVLIDSCSEDATYASSCHPDLMNSHDIPFLTLGEVIAEEQGMDSYATIPGPTADDDVLGGQGAAMANRFLKGQVQKLSARVTPPSVAAFEPERERRRRELLKSLGLDPMPAKTPLNAKVTGVLQRKGYRIEKLVFESRPKFYVTAHVYVPDGIRKGKLPAVMNVNGHWEHKKDEDRIQLRCAFQALQGYIAMAIDSPGWSFEGDRLIERRPEGDHNDFKLVEGGTNTTGYYLWDAIRAMDYLETRGDVDMSRVGITGASGGGLATLYAFAADPRYKAAVPVVYMSSMELAPDNGCLCNHVPGTCLVGDRSDVIGIEAPKPVLLMGAQNDGEFPPDAMRLTHKKMAETWKLFGKQDDVYVQIFPGGHDYSQPMRETMMGFFNRYVRGDGDGKPVPQPALQVTDPEDRSLLAADPPIPGERTMRDLSKEYLANAPAAVSWEEVVRINGGLPSPVSSESLQHWNLNEKKVGERALTFESEPGLVTPAIYVPNKVLPTKRVIYVSDAGKAVAIQQDPPALGKDSRLYIDILGTGELNGFDMRYSLYSGRSVAFTGAWQIVIGAELMRRHTMGHLPVEVVARGALSTQAAMYAALMDPNITKVTGYDCLPDWASVFQDSVTNYAVQPRAHLCGSLANLRSLVKNGKWY